MLNDNDNFFEILVNDVWKAGTKLMQFNTKLGFSLQYYVCKMGTSKDQKIPQNVKSSIKRYLLNLKLLLKSIPINDTKCSRQEFIELLILYQQHLISNENKNGINNELLDDYFTLYNAYYGIKQFDEYDETIINKQKSIYNKYIEIKNFLEEKEKSKNIKLPNKINLKNEINENNSKLIEVNHKDNEKCSEDLNKKISNKLFDSTMMNKKVITSNKKIIKKYITLSIEEIKKGNIEMSAHYIKVALTYTIENK